MLSPSQQRRLRASGEFQKPMVRHVMAVGDGG
jgi:hypothetical protein